MAKNFRRFTPGKTKGKNFSADQEGRAALPSFDEFARNCELVYSNA